MEAEDDDEKFLEEFCERNKDSKWYKITEEMWNKAGLERLNKKFNFNDKT